MEFTRKVFVLLGFLCLTHAAAAQVNRYMVLFKDKAGSSYSIDRPSDFLSERAIQRRIRQDKPLTSLDLPVNHNYVEAVRATGADVFFRTKWFNGLLVQCDAARIPAIRSLAFVDSVVLVAPKARLASGRKKYNLKQNRPKALQTSNQLSLNGLNHMHEAGNKGQSMVIAVLDAGFPGVDSVAAFENLINEERLNLEASFDFVGNTGNIFQYDEHGTEVLSIITAEIPDAYIGGAPEAHFQLYVTEDDDSEYRIEEYNWVFAAERADSAGADIISSSLGYYDFQDASMNYSKAQMDGKTAIVSQGAQFAADRGIVVVVSAGNEGNVAWQIITAPADAVDVIAVASVDMNGIKSSSSSVGPSADGRIKPDLAAMGVGTKVIRGNGSISSASGTSLAAPLIASLVAGVWTEYPDLTNLELIDLLKKTASLANNPNNQIGYGIPNFKAVVNYQERVDQEEIFAVYPNPVGDTLTVSPIDPDSISSCVVELINPLGQVLTSRSVEFDWYKRTFQADVSQLPAGVYFVRVLQNNKRYIFKIVKE